MTNSLTTNYYKQNKQNDDFELYVTKDHFYKAYGTLPTKTPTDFEQYVTAALLAVYKLVTELQSFTLMMASAQVVETSVNTNNSPSQDYTTDPDDHSNHNRTLVFESVSRKLPYVGSSVKNEKFI